jgi:hypothetical protein
MRNYTEVKDFLKTNGFVLELHTPGQSYISTLILDGVGH